MEKIYLSGPMTGLTVEEATERRSFYFNNLSDCFELVSPMRDWHLMTNTEEFKHTQIEAYSNDWGKENVSFCNDKEIMNRDRFDVLLSDGMILDLLDATRPSIGAIAELCWAHEHSKPIVLVMEDEGNINEHAFINEMSSFRVNSRERACEVIRSVFNKSPKVTTKPKPEDYWPEKQRDLEEILKEIAKKQKETPTAPYPWQPVYPPPKPFTITPDPGKYPPPQPWFLCKYF